MTETQIQQKDHRREALLSEYRQLQHEPKSWHDPKLMQRMEREQYILDELQALHDDETDAIRAFEELNDSGNDFDASSVEADPMQAQRRGQ